MSKGIPETFLKTLMESIESYTGLDFSKDREQTLQRAMRNAATNLGFENATSYCRWILAAPLGEDRIRDLVEYVTIGETHFFRDKKFFHVLEDTILPELIRAGRCSKRTLRIWSAGCATGEEPYSIAILVQKMLPDLSSWQIDIVGTDINREFLKKASEGIYNQWSFRGVSRSVQGAYFHKNGDGYTILPDIKRMVRFFEFNLNQDVHPFLTQNMRDWDMILCRNVLMYFAAERQQKVLDNLAGRLDEHGLITVSPAELSIVDTQNLVSETIQGVVVHRRVTPYRTAYLETMDLTSIPVIQLPAPITQATDLNLTNEAPAGLPVITPEPERVEKPTETPYQRALGLFRQGAYEQVIEILSSCPEINDGPKKSAPIMALIAHTYANQRNLEQALHWTQQIIISDKLNAEAHYLEGIILQEKDDLKGAQQSMKRALFLDPDFVVAHFALGNLTMRLGRPKASQKHFMTALDILAMFPENHVLPGSDDMTAGQLREIILAITPKENSCNGRNSKRFPNGK
jgi:chemotaxis protein methyltransferase CheR